METESASLAQGFPHAPSHNASLHIVYQAGDGSDFKVRNEPYLSFPIRKIPIRRGEKSGIRNWVWDVS